MIFVFVLALLSDLGANDQAFKDFLNRVWSPYCKGNTLLDCPSGQAQELRDKLQQEFQGGASFEQLENELRETYGDQVRMEPPASARGSLPYVIPALVLLAACIFVIFFWERKAAHRTKLKKAILIDHETQKKIESELQEKLS